jgi:hypothetical protein
MTGIAGMMFANRTPAAVSGDTDPYWANVGLLMSARNGTIVDLSTNALTLTKIGTTSSVDVTSATAKFGTQSVRFTASGTGYGTGALSVGPSSAINISTGDFTIEWWQNSFAAGNYMDPFGWGSWSIQAYVTSDAIAYEMDNNGGSPLLYSTSFYSLSRNNWHHVAIVREGNVFSFFTNGTRLTQTTQAITISNVSGQKLAIGDNDANTTYGTSQTYNGYMDEFRITKGVARYTGATYTVPTARFPAG